MYKAKFSYGLYSKYGLRLTISAQTHLKALISQMWSLRQQFDALILFAGEWEAISQVRASRFCKSNLKVWQAQFVYTSHITQQI